MSAALAQVHDLGPVLRSLREQAEADAAAEAARDAEFEAMTHEATLHPLTQSSYHFAAIVIGASRQQVFEQDAIAVLGSLRRLILRNRNMSGKAWQSAVESIEDAMTVLHEAIEARAEGEEL